MLKEINMSPKFNQNIQSNFFENYRQFIKIIKLLHETRILILQFYKRNFIIRKKQRGNNSWKYFFIFVVLLRIVLQHIKVESQIIYI